jgi:chromosome segregation ATPase
MENSTNAVPDGHNPIAFDSVLSAWEHSEIVSLRTQLAAAEAEIRELRIDRETGKTDLRQALVRMAEKYKTAEARVKELQTDLTTAREGKLKLGRGGQPPAQSL